MHGVSTSFQLGTSGHDASLIALKDYPKDIQ
jgi:hypothetical protein